MLAPQPDSGTSIQGTNDTGAVDENHKPNHSFFDWHDTQILAGILLSSSPGATATLGLEMPAALCGFTWISYQQNHILKGAVNRDDLQDGRKELHRV